jgi:hypothetical protein
MRIVSAVPRPAMDIYVDAGEHSPSTPVRRARKIGPTNGT